MTVWLIWVVMTALINLFVFIAVRGRWGRMVLVLAVASLIGTAVGNAIGDRLRLEPLRIGSFNLLSASITAQLLMLATVLLVVLVPAAVSADDGA